MMVEAQVVTMVEAQVVTMLEAETVRMEAQGATMVEAETVRVEARVAMMVEAPPVKKAKFASTAWKTHLVGCCQMPKKCGLKNASWRGQTARLMAPQRTLLECCEGLMEDRCPK
jgi:hypothetical protein